jgi:hypothetical protein
MRQIHTGAERPSVDSSRARSSVIRRLARAARLLAGPTAAAGIALYGAACGTAPDSAALDQEPEDTATAQSASTSPCGRLGASCCSHNSCKAGNLTCKNKKCRLKNGEGCDLEDTQCASGHCLVSDPRDDLGVCTACGAPNKSGDSDPIEQCCPKSGHVIPQRPEDGKCSSGATCEPGGGLGPTACSCGKPGATNGFNGSPVDDPGDEPCCAGSSCNDDSVCVKNSSGHHVCAFCGDLTEPCCKDIQTNHGCNSGTCRNGICQP